MLEEKELQLQTPETALREARHLITDLASIVDSEFRAPLELAIIEFVENLTKYASPSPLGVWAILNVQVFKTKAVVKVTSCPEHAADREQASAIIARIKESNDVAQLYKARLLELFKNPSERPQLGLLRVAYEGRFALSIRQSGPMMEIIAERNRHFDDAPSEY